ncbi:site-specific integrase [Buttiauxella sp. WJP83]|uniref:site-specific integrase n=1 Tax=Buttiauxella sp. WJP83 TaxID=2986951 RepID=UPI0022DD8246|nr:site-specific integrase [Buttiauxella sp. WJP83]WBM69165.1 site-specific integrase [Buttiauxella sp. WJP83]
MARPRKYNVNIPGLSCYTDARTKKVYWRYKHPVTGKFHGLGDNEEEARGIAVEANTRLAEQKMKQLFSIREKISTKLGMSITVTSWLDSYMKYQNERLSSGEIKLNTFKQKSAPVEVFRKECGAMELQSVGARDIAAIIEQYKERGQRRMAQVVRMVLVDVYKEAQHAGEVEPGYNPAMATRKPINKVQRERFSIDEWRVIFDAAESSQNYVQNSMLLAVVTGQRLGDISRMKFSDVWDDYLHVEQEKTGMKLAIPLSLRCNELDITLREVIARCRDMIISPHILHIHHTTGKAKRGGPVSSASITTSFSRVRDRCGLEWKEGTPPTFHEQRSLSERLYRAQGIDTQKLLGHKNQEMTDRYNDDRGKDWVVLAI